LISASASSITLKLDKFVKNGGSGIISYSLYVSSINTNQFTKVSSYDGSQSQEYTLINNVDELVSGEIYTFKYFASNKYGDGEFSQEASYRMCDALTKPNPPFKNSHGSSKKSISLTW